MSIILFCALRPNSRGASSHDHLLPQPQSDDTLVLAHAHAQAGDDDDDDDDDDNDYPEDDLIHHHHDGLAHPYYGQALMDSPPPIFVKEEEESKEDGDGDGDGDDQDGDDVRPSAHQSINSNSRGSEYNQ